MAPRGMLSGIHHFIHAQGSARQKTGFCRASSLCFARRAHVATSAAVSTSIGFRAVGSKDRVDDGVCGDPLTCLHERGNGRDLSRCQPRQHIFAVRVKGRSRLGTSITAIRGNASTRALALAATLLDGNASVEGRGGASWVLNRGCRRALERRA